MDQLKPITTRKQPKSEQQRKFDDLAEKHNFYIIRRGRDGEFTGIIIKKARIVDKLIELKFFRYDINAESYRYIKVTDNQVEDIGEEMIIDGFFQFIESLPPFKYTAEDPPIIITSETIRLELMERIGEYFSKRLLNRAKPDKNIEIMEDEKNSKYLFYRNGYIRITAKGYELRPYKELDKYIWKNKILERDFEEDQERGDFELFFLRVCGYKAGEIDQDTADRIHALKTITGYLLHGYFERKLRAVILTDSRISDEDEPNGRTGKTLYGKALGRILNSNNKSSVFVEINGKDFDFTNKFKYETCNLETQLISINDIQKGAKIDDYTNDITEGIQVNKKNDKPFPIRAKLLITTNRTIKIDGESNIDRVIQFEFSDWYDSVRSPETETGHWYFSEDWDKEQWNRFDTFLIGCIIEYFRSGLIQAVPINLLRRTLLDHTPHEFVDFMDDMFHNGYVEYIDEAEGQRYKTKLILEYDKKIDKKEIYTAFTQSYPSDFSPRTFKQRKLTQWIRAYTKYQNGLMPINRSNNTEGRSGGSDWIIFAKLNNDQ